MLCNSILETIGNTPLLKLNNLGVELGLKSSVYAKLESFNPFSVKDRPALAMLDGTGAKSGDVVIEPTSGNTGIGLAMVCSARGIRLIAVMPDNMSVERIKLMKHLGAEVKLTPAREGMDGAVAEAYALADSLEAPVVGQFQNADNPKAHYNTTAPEIYSDLDGKVDIFVAGVGTGGTFSGIAKYLKEQNPKILAYAVEPIESAVLSGEKRGSHGISGIGAGFVPQNFNRDLCDGIIKISTQDAYSYARLCARVEGVACGISGGAALKAAIDLAQNNADKNIVTVFPDNIERYLSVL